MDYSVLNTEQNDDQLCDLFRALALPVRLFIIRLIIRHNNAVSADDFDGAPFSIENINKQMHSLKQMGILKSQIRNRKSIYSVDEMIFTLLIQKFNDFLNSLDMQSIYHPDKGKPLDMETATAPLLDFGTYIKTQRLSFQLSQHEFAKRLRIDRSVLSKIECGKSTLHPNKLKDLSKIIYEDLNEIKTIYYSDRIAELMVKGNLEPAILNIVKSRTKA